jgi:TRAP-type C4-dicarboxylate transport system permease small subunit
LDNLSPLQRAARPFGLAAAAFLAFMMVFTTVAVVMRQTFDMPILGVVDIMELALVGLIFIALPGVFLRDDNVTVDVIDQFVSRKVRVALRFFGLLITFGFLVTVLIQMIPEMLDKWEFGEVTMTLGIPRYLHWIPIMFGFLASSVATLFVMYYYVHHGAPIDATLDGEKEQFE